MHVKNYIIRTLCIYSVLLTDLYADSLLFRIIDCLICISLQDEAKAVRQVDRHFAEMQEGILAPADDGNDGEFDPTRAAQLRILQLSLYLDQKSNKHVFRRLGQFQKITLGVVKTAPKRAAAWTKLVLKIPKKLNRARQKLRMKLNRDGSAARLARTPE